MSQTKLMPEYDTFLAPSIKHKSAREGKNMSKSSSQNLTSGLRCKGWKFYHRSFAPEFNPSFVIFRVNFLALQNYKEFDGTIEKTKQTKLN